MALNGRFHEFFWSQLTARSAEPETALLREWHRCRASVCARKVPLLDKLAQYGYAVVLCEMTNSSGTTIRRLRISRRTA
jgi:hypothetical protein